MENKINIAELLKDCPKGMELDSPLFDGLVLESIEDDSEYPIRVRTKEGEIWSVTCYGCWDNAQSARCVIYPKGKTTWEGFAPPPCVFNDGDIIYVWTSMFKWISIFKYSTADGIVTYADYCLSNRRFYGINDDCRVLCQNNRIRDNRLATEEEKRMFFNELAVHGYVWDAESKTLTHDENVNIAKFNDGDLLYVKTANGFEMVFAYRKTYDDKYLRKYVSSVKQTGMLLVSSPDAVCEINQIEKIRLATDTEQEEFFSVCDRNGYKWDSDNKTLEKKTDTERQDSVNKFDTGTLKPFDKVLVRDGAGFWRPNLFGADKITGYRYLTSGGNYKECVPYEGNEHLVGTKNDCDDYYKTWTV